MVKYSKYADVDALLSKCAGSLTDIQSHYERCLTAQVVPAELLVEIKEYFGNLRSPLDYLNGRIVASDRYFPICDQKADFLKRYGKVAPVAQAVLEKWQPYNNQQWLKWFNLLNNKNKHVALTPQKRVEDRRVSVTAPGGATVSWGSGVTFGRGVSVMGVPIDPRTQMPVPNNSVSTQVVTWVDFVFDNSGELAGLPPNLSALGFLKSCLRNVAEIVKDVETVLP